MELHPLHRNIPVPNPHDLPFLRPGVDAQAVGDGLAPDDERMVARGDERVLQPGEHPCTVVVDERCLAVHRLRGADDIAPVSGSDGLVPEADSQNGDFPREAQDGLH